MTRAHAKITVEPVYGQIKHNLRHIPTTSRHSDRAIQRGPRLVVRPRPPKTTRPVLVAIRVFVGGRRRGAVAVEITGSGCSQWLAADGSRARAGASPWAVPRASGLSLYLSRWSAKGGDQ